MFQQVTVMGRLAKDMEVRSTKNGKTIGRFSIPCSEKWEGGEHTEWFNCDIWGDRAQKIMPYMVKGKSVMVTGTLKTREHEGKRFTSVTVDKLQFGGDGRNMVQQQNQQQQNQQQQNQQQQNQQQQNQQPESQPKLDDIPF